MGQDSAGFEIGYVVLTDRVGFFALPGERKEALDLELAETIRACPPVRRYSDALRLVVDQGDSHALIFFGDPVHAAQAASFLFRMIASGPEAPLRIGCHCGPVLRRKDKAGKWTVSGPAIEEGRCVMACSDGKSVVASSDFAERLEPIGTWRERFVEESEREVVLGKRLKVCSMVVDPSEGIDPPEGTEEEVLGLETPGGAVPLGSRFYITREADEEFGKAMAARSSIVLVKGARQIGKTSLLARALGQASATGSSVALTDFQALGSSELQSCERLYQVLAYELASQLGLEADIRGEWDDLLGPNTNLERFVSTVVLGQIDGHIVWAMDEVDRLFTLPYGGDFFGLIRSWHNRRALRAASPWSRLTLAIAHATEAHLFISDLNQSPFNVGVRLELADFTLEEVRELNRRYREPLSEEETIVFHRLTGGQPYLCRRGLDELSRGAVSLSEFEKTAPLSDGLFSDHLRRILIGVQADLALAAELRKVVSGERCSREAFFRLRSAGVLVGDSPQDARFRCQIYQAYLSKHL